MQRPFWWGNLNKKSVMTFLAPRITVYWCFWRRWTGSNSLPSGWLAQSLLVFLTHATTVKLSELTIMREFGGELNLMRAYLIALIPRMLMWKTASTGTTNHRFFIGPSLQGSIWTNYVLVYELVDSISLEEILLIHPLLDCFTGFLLTLGLEGLGIYSRTV